MYLPIKYLGVPLRAKCKNARTWEPVIELFERRLFGWKKTFLFKGCRLTLIKSTLTHLPICFWSSLMIPVKTRR